MHYIFNNLLWPEYCTFVQKSTYFFLWHFDFLSKAVLKCTFLVWIQNFNFLECSFFIHIYDINVRCNHSCKQRNCYTKSTFPHGGGLPTEKLSALKSPYWANTWRACLFYIFFLIPAKMAKIASCNPIQWIMS